MSLLYVRRQLLSVTLKDFLRRTGCVYHGEEWLPACMYEVCIHNIQYADGGGGKNAEAGKGKDEE